MPNPIRVVSLPNGSADIDGQQVNFTLASSGGKSFNFVAKIGILQQVIRALARMYAELESHLRATDGVAVAYAMAVAKTRIHKERWSDAVLMELTDQDGIPYLFQMTSQTASGIADQLKTESAKPTQTGTA